jgi:hypothetical protein
MQGRKAESLVSELANCPPTMLHTLKPTYLELGNVKKPCRIVCHMEGVEWFIYNRTPVYYALQEILEMGLRSNTNETAELKSTASRSLDVESQQFDEASSSLFRRLMPVQMECTRGSIIFGNPELPTMTVLQFRQASSIYNTDQSRSKLDHYKSSIDVILREPKMSLKHNADFTESTDNEGLGHRRQSSSASYVIF